MKSRSSRPWLVLSVLAVSFGEVSLGNEPEAAAAFAERLTGVTWELRGTNSLKRIRFDGKAMHNFRRDGSPGSAYETIFPDFDIVRIRYADGSASWFFFSDDFRFATSVKVLSERTFALSEGGSAKSVEEFPKDIEGVVYQSTDDDEERLPAKFRWNGEELQFGTRQGGEWRLEGLRPVVANRRVLEARATEDMVVWFVFGADGSEAWFLQVERIFGGHRSDVPAKEAMSASATGLAAQDNDLANHLMDLIDAKADRSVVSTLQRQFERKLRQNPGQLEALKKRVDDR